MFERLFKIAGPVRRFVSCAARVPLRPFLTIVILVGELLVNQPARPPSKLPFFIVCWR